MTTRIYIITPLPERQQINRDGKLICLELGEIPALVDAASAAQATAYVAGRLFTVRPATGHEIANLMGAGHKVQQAGKAAISPADTGSYLPASKAGEAP